jgi:hypothetical protein
VPGEGDAQKIINLSLLEISPSPYTSYRRYRWIHAIVTTYFEYKTTITFQGGKPVDKLEIVVVVGGYNIVKIIEIKSGLSFQIFSNSEQIFTADNNFTKGDSGNSLRK